MSKIGSYIKRGIKYVLYEHKQPIVKVNICEKESTHIFEKKVFIVTGGSRGIGYSIAKKIVNEKGTVVITGRSEESLKKAQEKLGELCECVIFDIENTNNCNEFIEDIYSKYGRIDGLINNAGISLHEWDFFKVDEEKYNSQFNINLKGSYFLTQAYIKKIISKQQEGNVVFISSEAGTMCDDLPYGLTKASIDSLVKSLSYRFYKDGIRVNAVAPGVTATDMTGADKNGNMFYNKPSGRIFIPEEVAEVVLFILSDFSKCISGEIIHTNGGNHNTRRY